jgi:uncharacterized membrane protein
MTAIASPPSPDEPVPVTASEDPARRRSRLRLAALMIVAGVMHFVAPKPFDQIIPRRLGHPRFWVYASGVVELLAGGLLLDRRTARVGGVVTTATIVAVYPANIKAAVDAGPPVNPVAALTWLRLPFQVPLFTWALGHARG